MKRCPCKYERNSPSTFLSGNRTGATANRVRNQGLGSGSDGGESCPLLLRWDDRVLSGAIWFHPNSYSAHNSQVTAARGQERSNKEVFPGLGKQEWTSVCRDRAHRSRS